MEKKEVWEIGGFRFDTEEEAKLAKTEQDKVNFLEERMRYDDPESILSIYNKAIENKIFRTPVGLQYLQKLKEYLEEKNLLNRARGIPQTPQNQNAQTREAPEPQMARARVQPSQYRALRSRLRKSVLLNIVLVLLVIAMFVITLTGKNANILNYERVLTDRYAEWEQELTEREAAVREKEKAMHKGE